MNSLITLARLITALLMVLSLYTKAGLTEEARQPFLKAGITNRYYIDDFLSRGVTPEVARSFLEKTPAISPDRIYLYTQRNITANIAASFQSQVVDNPLFIEAIMTAGLTPHIANRYVNAGIRLPNNVIEYANAGIAPHIANSYVRAGIHLPRSVIEYANAGLTPEIASSYVSAGIHVPSNAIEYANAGIAPEIAGSYVSADIQLPINVIEYANAGLTPKDLSKYKGLFSSLPYLEKLYISKIPTDFFRQAISKDLSLEDAISLYFRGIDLDTYQTLTSEEETCNAYPSSHIKFEHLDSLQGYKSEKEPIPLPKILFSRLNTVFLYSCMECFSTSDQMEIFKAVEDKVTGLQNPSIHDLLYLAADIVAQKINYALVDEGEFSRSLPEGCSIIEYWRKGIGDCDKYAVLATVVFAQLKQLFPNVLANVYLTTDKLLKPVRKDHAWNTVVIAEKERLIITYIDVTFYDNIDEDESFWTDFFQYALSVFYPQSQNEDMNGDLGALDAYHFNQKHFLQEYENSFCQPK